jgi:hypothetical protein
MMANVGTHDAGFHTTGQDCRLFLMGMQPEVQTVNLGLTTRKAAERQKGHEMYLANHYTLWCIWDTSHHRF